MSPNTENDAPDMILCVFPNAHKVLLLSNQSESNTEYALDSDFVFGENFYSSIEAKINSEIRSNNFHLLSGNGIPEKVENIVREATISAILEALNDKIGKSISQDSISSLTISTSFKLNSLIFSPTSTIVVDAFSVRAMFIPTSSVGPEYCLLLIAISTFMIVWANKKLI